jgi:hypothetical protein
MGEILYGLLLDWVCHVTQDGDNFGTLPPKTTRTWALGKKFIS